MQTKMQSVYNCILGIVDIPKRMHAEIDWLRIHAEEFSVESQCIQLGFVVGKHFEICSVEVLQQINAILKENLL